MQGTHGIAHPDLRAQTQLIPPQSILTTVVSSGTIVTDGQTLIRCTTGGAVTGVIVTPGRFNGQQVWVMNESGNSITMAASGTSNVALGTGMVIAALTKQLFLWNNSTNLWY